MPRKSRLLAAVVTLVLALGLTACTPTSKWRYEGEPVTGLEETVSQLDAMWRQRIAQSDRAANAPEESGCWLQVGEGNEVSLTALCGPVRWAASDETVWEGIELFPATDNRSLTLALEPSAEFAVERPAPNTVLTRPDDTTTSPDVELGPAPGKPAALGQLIESHQFDSDAHGWFELPDVRVMVDGLGTASHTGSESDWWQAPDAATFVLVNVETSESETGTDTDGKATTFAVNANQQSYPISPGNWAIAVPGDGTDATLVATFDGRSQSVNLASGALEPADPIYLSSSSHGSYNNNEIEKKQGNLEFTSGHNVDVSVATWNARSGWAPEGSKWLEIDVRMYNDFGALRDKDGGPFGGWGCNYGRATLAFQSLSVITDGTTVEADAAGTAIENAQNNANASATLDVPIPRAASTARVEATYSATAKILPQSERNTWTCANPDLKLPQTATIKNIELSTDDFEVGPS